MTPFALTLARPDAAVTAPACTYDPARQLSVLPTGRPAVTAPTSVYWTATSSTAGSKTNRDDTDEPN